MNQMIAVGYFQLNCSILNPTEAINQVICLTSELGILAKFII